MENNVKTPGVSISTILLVVFVVLKLTHNIEWKWVWVLSPLWLPLAAVVALFVILVVFGSLR